MGREGASLFLDPPVQFDVYRPSYHLQPYAGWLNDPNGPVYYKGRYHMFYQHLPEACEWDFGIIWGHSVSEDLVHWRQLPPALVPTPGGPDADGCFSGCCVIDPVTGTPTILYTGVRLRSNAACTMALPPPEHDLGLVWIEAQMAAVPADPNDDLLIAWSKHERAFLDLPPNHVQLTGWRDPFIYTANTATVTGEWGTGFTAPEHRMLIGSGVKGQGGTALVYSAPSIQGEWEFVGELCSGSSLDTGFVWECPLLVPLFPIPVDAAGGGEGRGPAQEAAAGALPPAPAPPYWLVGGAGVPAPILTPFGSRHDPSSRASRERGWRELGRLSLGASPAHGEDEPRTPQADGSLSRADSFQFSADGGSSVRLSDLAASRSIKFWRSPTQGRRAAAAGVDQASEEEGEEEEEGGGSRASMGTSGDEAGLDAVAPGGPWHGASAPADSRLANLAFTAALQQERGVGGGVRRLSLDRAATLEGWVDEQQPTHPPAPPAALVLPPALQPLAVRLAAREGDAVQGLTRSPPRPPLAAASPPAAAAAPPLAAATPAAPPPLAEPAAGGGPADARGRAPIGMHLPAQQRFREVSEDVFASRFNAMRGIRPRRTASVEQRIGRASEEMDTAHSAVTSSPRDPERQWHLFTVSPDAPTNPVLFWMGHASDDGTRFELESAKGPFRLDLGDILYAPNVLQDREGRWLLWGWLQEKRRVGSYDYAGCLTLPRELHATRDGRLVQAPLPELGRLRQGQGHQMRDVALPPTRGTPVEGVEGDCLDIVITVERGGAYAAGLLFRSYEAGDENGAALLFDWETRNLEVVFGVPPAWAETHLPVLAGAGGDTLRGSDEGGGAGGSPAWEHVEPSFLLTTPRFAVQSSGASTPSMLSPPPWEGEAWGVGGAGGLGVAGEGGLAPLARATSSLNVTRLGGLRRTSSYLRVGGGGQAAGEVDEDGDLRAGLEGLLGRDPGGMARSSAESLRDPGTLSRASMESAPGGVPGSGLSRSSLDHAMLARLARTSAQAAPRRGAAPAPPAGDEDASGGFAPSAAPATTQLGGRPISRTASFMGTPRTDAPPETLEQLLEDLAGPVRDAPPPPPATDMRRVGGPLAMRAQDVLHLRVLLDHSSLEVFTGTGEVLSTRLYRGTPPPGTGPGIDLVSFGGGPAHLRSLAAWELRCVDAATASVPLSPVGSPRGGRGGAGSAPPGTPGFTREAHFDELMAGLDGLAMAGHEEAGG